MLCRHWIIVAVLTASGLLVAGCGSLPARPTGGAKGEGGSAAKRERADEKTLERLARAHAHYAAGVIHEVDGERAAAEEEYYQAALLDPEDEVLILEVSAQLLRSKKLEEALELVRRTAKDPESSGEIYARLGLIYAELDKPEKAETANRLAIKKSPDSLAGYHNLCQGYLAEKRPTEALKVLAQAARRPQPSADFLIGLAEICATVGIQAPEHRAAANKEAQDLLSRAVKLGALTPLLQLRVADGFNLLGNSAKAAELYLAVLKDPPDLPLVQERVRANLAAIYLQGSDHSRASEQLQAILRDDPTNPQAYYYLGQLELQGRKPAEAADHLSKALLLRPELESAYYYLALAQLDLDKPNAALATLEQARQKFGQNFTLEFYTGLAYSRLKAYPEAVRHLVAAEVIAKATSPVQLNDGFYFRLGAACERKGDYAQAEKYFEKCLQLAPDSPETLNYLGYMWAERGVKLEKARELIEKAVKAEPKNAAYLDSLAWVLFKLGQAKAALPYLLRAVELSEEPDATLYDHLGDIYAALQEPDKALEAWRKSVSVEANESVQKKLEAASPK